jgi:hypothetical protein
VIRPCIRFPSDQSEQCHTSHIHCRVESVVMPVTERLARARVEGTNGRI